MVSNAWKCASLVLVQFISASAYSQELEFPILNSIGRYLGVGYTRGGYHAAQDGRLDLVSQLHPPGNYRLGGLPQNYGYPTLSTPTVRMETMQYLPAPVAAPALPKKPETIAAPKPVEPTPQWLEGYLQPENSGQSESLPMPERKVVPKDLEDESSPSDLLLEENNPAQSNDLDSLLNSRTPRPATPSNNRYQQARIYQGVQGL